MLDVLIVSYYGCDSVDDDVGDDLLLTAMNTTMSSTARLGRKTTRDDEFEQSRTALPKNLIRPLPVQDRKDERFRRPALPRADARQRLDGVDYDGGASCEMRQNPRCFSVCLWPQPVAVYILGPEAVLCRDHNPKPTRFLIRILTGQEIKNLSAKT